MSPSVLFLCVKNGGKSQIAAALMRQLAGSSVEVLSAGTAPGGTVNAEARESVEQVGATMEGEYPKPIDPAVLARVDRVVVLGSQAHVEPVAGMHAPIEVWETDEPSLRGIGGGERVARLRDDSVARARDGLRESASTVFYGLANAVDKCLCHAAFHRNRHTDTMSVHGSDRAFILVRHRRSCNRYRIDTKRRVNIYTPDDLTCNFAGMLTDGFGNFCDELQRLGRTHVNKERNEP